MTPPDGYRQAGQGWHRKCHDGSPTVVWWFDPTAAHEVTPADTVEVTACGENRLPAAGTHAARSNPCATGAHYRGRRTGSSPQGALTLRLHPAHDRAAHKAKEGGST